ncbi:MAG: XRE family transcriptional regulator [Clostridia bacterium]
MMYSENYIAIPPGETIKEQLSQRAMTQKEFTLRMGMSSKHINRLINGNVELTHQVSLKLESVLGVPASFWNNLESTYRENLARVQDELNMHEEEEIAKLIPYAQIAKLGWVDSTRLIKDKVRNLRAFFEVSDLSLISNLPIPGVAFRIANNKQKNNYALAVWTQKAKIEARKEEVSTINISKLKKRIQEIRSLSLEPFLTSVTKLSEIFSQCGIALVLLPHINDSYVHGASFIDGKKIVLVLSTRGKNADIFWFSLFHELHHIIENHIKNYNNCDENEISADVYARDTLILPNDYSCFVEKSNFSKDEILEFSKKIGIHPGIVLGRLQKDNYVLFNYHTELKDKYIIN